MLAARTFSNDRNHRLKTHLRLIIAAIEHHAKTTLTQPAVPLESYQQALEQLLALSQALFSPLFGSRTFFFFFFSFQSHIFKHVYPLLQAMWSSAMRSTPTHVDHRNTSHPLCIVCCFVVPCT